MKLIVQILFLCLLYSNSFSNLTDNPQKQLIPFETANIIPARISLIDSLNYLSTQIIDSLKDESFHYATDAFNMSKQINYLKGEGEALLNLGIFYIYSNQLSKSLDFLFKALDISAQLKDDKFTTAVLSKISLNFTKLQKPEQAKFYFQKSLSTAIKIHDTNQIIESLVHGSEMFLLEESNENALSALFQASWYAHMNKDYRRIAGINRYLGKYFLTIGNYHKARFYFNRAIKLSLEHDFLSDLGTLYSYLAFLYSSENKHDMSLRYNKMALLIRQKINQEDQTSSSYLNVGKDFLSLNREDSSIFYFQKGLELAQKHNIDKFKELISKYLYDLYINKTNWKRSLEYYILYIEARDSMSLIKKRQESALIEANKLIYEKDKQFDRLEFENQLQKTRIKYDRLRIISLGILLAIIIAALFYVYRQYIRNKKSRIALQQLNAKLDSEIEERKQVEAQLSRSEALHRFLTNNSLDVITRLDNKNKIVYISPSCINIFGYDQDEMMELENIEDLIDPLSLKTMQNSFQEMLRTKGSAKFIYRNRKKDGTSFWAESHVNPFFDKESGELTEMIAVIRDISERISHEEALQESNRQKEMLMREIHHRAKNNFAILISLLSIQKFQTENQELFEILSDLQTRMRTLVLIHEQLYKNSSVDVVSFGQYVVNLATIISNAFRMEGINLHSEISECMLNIETALPLGLVVNELLTNSYKYAFAGRKKGNVHVKLSPNLHADNDEDLNWELIIEDDGIGLPESFTLENASSMGSQIVFALVNQVHGQIEISGKEGTSFRILFPGTISK